MGSNNKREFSMSLFKKTTDDESAAPVTRKPARTENPKMNLYRDFKGSSAKEVTSIGQGSLLTGRIEIKSDKHELHIDGAFKGEIHSNSIVIIGQSGYVDGEIYASKLIVSGRLTGSSDSDRIELITGGNVEGVLTAAVLTIDALSSFHGQSNVRKKSGDEPGKPRQPQKPPSETPKARAIDPVKLNTPQKPPQQDILKDSDAADAVKLTTRKQSRAAPAPEKPK